MMQMDFDDNSSIAESPGLGVATGNQIPIIVESSSVPTRRSAALTLEQRRATHNATERARRENLNGKFQELANVNPLLKDNRKPSKAQIVSKSLEYIQLAQGRMGAMQALVHDLIADHSRLVEAANTIILSEEDSSSKKDTHKELFADKSAEYLARLEAINVIELDQDKAMSPFSLKSPGGSVFSVDDFQNPTPQPYSAILPNSPMPFSASSLRVPYTSFIDATTNADLHSANQNMMHMAQSCPSPMFLGNGFQQQQQPQIIKPQPLAPNMQPFRQTGFNVLPDSSLHSTLSPLGASDDMHDVLSSFLMD